MSTSNSTLTQERLKELLHYEPETGVFTWLATRGPARKGGIAGCLDPSGYFKICVLYQQNWAHRLAWFYMTGVWPDGEIDHIDLNRSNTKWSNLRDGTKTNNIQNSIRSRKSNVLGVLGVTRNRGKFSASITVDGKKRHLGSFVTQEQAHDVYLKAKRDLHPGCTI